MDDIPRQHGDGFQEQDPEFVPTDSPQDFIDDEMEKDKWDVRKIPGCHPFPHRSEYLLSFEKVPTALRPVVKRFMRVQVMTTTFATCRYYLQYVPRFTAFYATLHTGCDSFRDLSRTDIEKYVAHLRAAPMCNGAESTANHIARSLWSLRSFLAYLERSMAPEAPLVSLNQLIWREDAGRPPKPSDEPKFIPNRILEQLDELAHLLPTEIFPVVTLLRASGWRIADVLGLKWDFTTVHFQRRA